MILAPLKMLLERCSHSASYACGLNCRFYKRRSQAWTASNSDDLDPPSWTRGLSSAGVGSKRSREELAADFPSKRRESGGLTSFGGSFRLPMVFDDHNAYPVAPRANSGKGRTSNTSLVVEEDSPVSKAGVKESKLSGPRIWQVLHNEHRDDSSEDLSTRSGFKKAFSGCLSAPVRSIRFPPHLGRHKHRTFTDMWRSRSIPQASTPDTSARSSSPIPVASPAETQNKDVGNEDTIEPPRLHRKRVETMAVKERKRFLVDKPTIPMIIAMRKWVAETYALLDVHREEDNCWFHPSPPPPHPNGRARGAISRCFFWGDETGRHCIWVNFGVVALIVKHYLTDEQREGYITKGWHLSHLCGNWTCCNWKHFTVEPGTINISRNVCFRLPRGCHHHPQCMKDKKKRLLPVGSTLSMNKTLGRSTTF